MRYIATVIIIGLLLMTMSLVASGQEPVVPSTGITWVKIEFYDGSYLLITRNGGQWMISGWSGAAREEMNVTFRIVKELRYGIGQPWRFPLVFPTPTSTSIPMLTPDPINILAGDGV